MEYPQQSFKNIMAERLVLLVLVSLLFIVTSVEPLPARSLIEVVHRLGLARPVFVSGESKEYNARLMAAIAPEDTYSKMVRSLAFKENLMSTIVLLADNYPFEDMANFTDDLESDFALRPGHDSEVIGQHNPLLIVYNTSSAIRDLVADPPIKIHQMIFFLDTSTMKVTEHYQINGIKKSNTIGSFEAGSEALQLKKQSGLLDVLTRRSDFSGLHMTVMVEYQVPFNYFTDDYKVILNSIPSLYGSEAGIPWGI